MELEQERGLYERNLQSILKYYEVIKEFPERGFSTAQPIDMNAEAAYNRLISQGFTASAQNIALSTERFSAK